MFKRVLIAEDHESNSNSVQSGLANLQIPQIEYTYYCDDALLQIRKQITADIPFDLLITDLSFDRDHREQTLSNGIDLIRAVRDIQPNLKIIVFSIEKKATTIKTLLKQYQIDAYVGKGRGDIRELKEAIENVAANKTYVSHSLRQLVRQKNTHEFDKLDITIISLLSTGTFIKDIPDALENHQIKRVSLSTVEKRLNQMKEAMDFSKNEQLVAYCKDSGII